MIIVDGYDSSYFKISAMAALVNLRPGSIQTQAYLVPSLSPGTEDGKANNTDKIIPITSFLRNAAEVQCNILDEDYNRLRTITRETFISKDTKSSGYYVGASVKESRIWDGTVNNEILPDGLYYYEIKTKLQYEGSDWQSKKIPIYIDTVPPEIKDLDYDFETGELTWTAIDETADPDIFFVYLGDQRVGVMKSSDCRVEGTEDKYSYNIGVLPKDKKAIIQIACIDYSCNFVLTDEYIVGDGDFDDSTVPYLYLETPDIFEHFNAEEAPENKIDFEGYIIRNGIPIDSVTINGEEAQLTKGNVPVKDQFGEIKKYTDGYYYEKTLELEDGVHDVFVEAKYNGDSAISITRTIFIDTQKAEMTAEVLERDPSSETAKIKVNMKDNMPQLSLYIFDSLEYSFDGADKYTELMPVEKEIVLEVKLKDGENIFELKLVDMTGNETIVPVKIIKE